MYTTLDKIKENDPCSEGWETLLKSLDKSKSDDEPLTYAHILESNGTDDAIWALVCHEDQNLVRKFACDCAEHVLHLYEKKYPDEKRLRQAIEVSRLFAVGKVTQEELNAARAAARAAAWDAAGAAARAAAWDAAGAAEQKWQTELFKEYFCKGDE